MTRSVAWLAEAAVVVGVYGVTTFALLYPLFVAPGSTIFDPPLRDSLSLFDLGDMYTVIWVMAWGAHALWTDPARLFDANIFHPAPHTLTSSEHMLGHLPIFGSVYGLSGNPILANQVNLFAALTLSGAAMYALLRHWGAGRAASFTAGLIFTYTPLRLTFVTHVHLLAGQYLVLAIIALDRLLADGRTRWALAFAALLALQCLCSFYLAYMSLVALAAYGIAVMLTGAGRRRWRRLAVAAAAAAVGLVPFVLLALPYLAGRDVGTLPHEQEQALLRYLSVRLQRLLLVREEGYYAGLSVAVLAVLGALPGAASVPWARLGAVAMAVACIVFGMGPVLEIDGALFSLPYEWTAALVPGFAAMRGPIRFVLIAMVGVAALAGLGCERLRRALAPLPGAGAMVALAVLAVVAWDYRLHERQFPARPAEVGARVPPVYRALAALPRGPVLEIPPGGYRDPVGQARESVYTLRSVYHWQPLLNGRTGYQPPSYAPLMALARAMPDPRALELLQRAAGLRWIVLHTDSLPAGQRARWAAPAGLRHRDRFAGAVLFEVEEQRPADLVARLLAAAPSTSVLGTPLAPIAAAQRRAEIELRGPPRRAPAQAALAVSVAVRNPTERAWPAFTTADRHRVRLGYRWRDAAGAVVAANADGDWLPYDLMPGEAAVVTMVVPTGLPPGDYDLAVAVTQDEHWFAGAAQARISLGGEPAGRQPAGA